jgi:hypothetical protein
MNEKQVVARGRDASAVLDNEAFKAAISTLKTSVTEQWKNCPVRDAEGQLLLLQLAKLTDKFESIIVGYIDNGKLAQNRIKLDEIRNESAGQRMLRRVTG